MIIMFAELTGEWLTPEEEEIIEIRRNLSCSDSFQLFLINFKMKFLAKKVGTKGRYVVHKKVSSHLREYLIKVEKYRLNKYYSKRGKKYYHINF